MSTLMTPNTGRELHVDVALSNVVVNRRPAGFIADRLLPVTTVDKQSNFYVKYQHGHNRRYDSGMTLRAPGTAARKVHTSASSDSYFAKNYALGTELYAEDVVNADAILRWADRNAQMITDRLLVDYEYRVANLCVTTANVLQVRTVATAWNVGGDVMNDVTLAKQVFRQRTGLRPNRMIIPEPVMAQISINSTMRSLIFGQVNGGLVTPDALAALWQIDEILVPYSQVNTYDEAVTIANSFTLADIWGNNVWLANVNLLSGEDTDTWLNAFRWTSPLLGVPWAVQRYPFDPKLKKYELDIDYYQDEKVVSSDLAIRIMNVISPSAFTPS